MKTSELISHLSSIKEYAGDIDVCVIDTAASPLVTVGDVSIGHNPKKNRVELCQHMRWEPSTCKADNESD